MGTEASLANNLFLGGRWPHLYLTLQSKVVKRERGREREREREREEVGVRHHLPLGRAQSNTKRKVPPFFKIDAYIRVNPTLTD